MIKIQLKLTQAVLERLLQDDAQLEAIVGEQLLTNLADSLKDRISKSITEGIDLQGMHIGNVTVNELVRAQIRNEVGNYLRIEAPVIRPMIIEEVQKQLPGVIQSQVASELKKAASRVLEGK
ncbi:MAG: hypothetical protein M0R80_01155 [Proteobacteria bacterium]|jgi:ethanolamine ammonia-lyase small subunit|nr:hypothetical protein [Pseudomonadota bacterium]